MLNEADRKLLIDALEHALEDLEKAGPHVNPTTSSDALRRQSATVAAAASSFKSQLEQGHDGVEQSQALCGAACELAQQVHDVHNSGSSAYCERHMLEYQRLCASIHKLFHAAQCCQIGNGVSCSQQQHSYMAEKFLRLCDGLHQAIRETLPPGQSTVDPLVKIREDSSFNKLPTFHDDRPTSDIGAPGRGERKHLGLGENLWLGQNFWLGTRRS